MAKGWVKWFSGAKGYGFVIREGSDSELFAHYTAIDMQGYKTLVEGEDVEFEIEDTDKGLQAKNTRRCEPRQAPIECSRGPSDASLLDTDPSKPAASKEHVSAKPKRAPRRSGLANTGLDDQHQNKTSMQSPASQRRSESV